MASRNAHQRFDILCLFFSSFSKGLTNPPDDVLDVISQLIKSVDSVEGSTNAGFILPHIQHWDRVARVVRNGVVGAILIPSAVAGVAILTVVGAIILVPVLMCRKVAESVSQPTSIVEPCTHETNP